MSFITSTPVKERVSSPVLARVVSLAALKLSPVALALDRAGLQESTGLLIDGGLIDRVPPETVTPNDHVRVVKEEEGQFNPAIVTVVVDSPPGTGDVPHKGGGDVPGMKCSSISSKARPRLSTGAPVDAAVIP
jgi:hypothetical protein